MKEIWKDVKGYEGLYEVSDLGRVKSTARYGTGGGIKTISRDRYGYGTVCLSKNGSHNTRTVHRLVAIAFLEKDDEREFVNHIDGIKINNKIENLEWCNRSENQKHAYRLGLQKSDMKKAQKRGAELRRRKVKQFDKSGKFLKEFDSLTKASAETKTSRTCISQCLSKQIKSAGGFIWMCSEDVGTERVAPIAEFNSKLGKSGIRNITFNEKRQFYTVKIKGVYVGQYKKIEDAICAKERYVEVG